MLYWSLRKIFQNYFSKKISHRQGLTVSIGQATNSNTPLPLKKYKAVWNQRIRWNWVIQDNGCSECIDCCYKVTSLVKSTVELTLNSTCKSHHNSITTTCHHTSITFFLSFWPFYHKGFIYSCQSSYIFFNIIFCLFSFFLCLLVGWFLFIHLFIFSFSFYLFIQTMYIWVLR